MLACGTVIGGGDADAQTTELPEIVVQSATPVSGGDSGFASVTTVNEQELTSRGAASLGDALAG